LTQAYNFLASWQLFPEKGTYEGKPRPKSGNYKISARGKTEELTISHSWVTIENESFITEYSLPADGNVRPFDDKNLADEAVVNFINHVSFEICFFNNKQLTLRIIHEIMPNGFLRITQKGSKPDGTAYANIEFYHKQTSVLPYAASVAGAVIKPTEEGVIRHKALAAMEEQTNMQLEQIRKQIELLALQAQEIHKRKELSMMIYSAKLSFKPEIGQVYYLYEKQDDTYTISMISPEEWGAAIPYKSFIATVQLLADHTWKEI